MNRVKTGTPSRENEARPGRFELTTFGFGGRSVVGTTRTIGDKPRSDAASSDPRVEVAGQRSPAKDTATVAKPGPLFRPTIIDRALALRGCARSAPSVFRKIPRDDVADLGGRT